MKLYIVYCRPYTMIKDNIITGLILCLSTLAVFGILDCILQLFARPSYFSLLGELVPKVAQVNDEI